jgi:hypothetical protein
VPAERLSFSDKLYCRYGVNGAVDEELFKIFDADYTTITEALPTMGETGYAALYRNLYQWLIDEGHYVGTVG